MTSGHAPRRAALASAAFAVLLAAGSLPTRALGADQVLNLYSARHYQTDEALYDGFTRATGIRINRIEADDAGIVARLRSEGSASPADVVLLVDAARLWRAQAAGLFRPIRSATLEASIPAHLRDRDEGKGVSWFGFSTRARVIVYDKASVAREDVATYESLADPKNRGRVCTRSGSHPYNLSLFGAMLEHLGPERTEKWLAGIVSNMARPPKGGDTDQIRAVASGECKVAITNSYYLARLMRSDKPADRALVERVGVVFPNQASWGTHVNVAGGAVAAHSKNPEAAQKFLEYLAQPQAQAYFANGNNEWPVVGQVRVENPALAALGPFRAETTSAAVFGRNQVPVQQMLDRVGYR